MKRALSILTSTVAVLSLLLMQVPAWAASTNLIANPSAETAVNGMPQNWTTNSWGTNSPTFTYSNTGHTGSHSLYVKMANYTSGDAKWMADQVAVTPGQTYVYSDYYEANVDTELDAAYTAPTGAMSFVYLDTVPASTTWQQAMSTFKVPSGVATVSIYHIIGANGWLQTDDFSLTAQVPTPPPTAGNLLANASFETADGASPAGWQKGGWGTNTASYAYLNGTAHSGSRSVQVSVSAYTSGDVKWFANPVTVSAGASYTYSDYYTADVATRVVAAFTNGNGTDSYVELTGAPAASSWTQHNTTFTVPSGIQSVTIYHLLDKVGTLTIDDTSLAPAAAASSNLVTNPSFETSSGSVPAGWLQDQWGTNTAKFTYVSGDAHTGSRSAKVTVSNYSSGDAKWYFTPVTTLTPGGQYSFSAWYKTSTQPHVVVMYTDASGTQQYFNMPNPLPAADAATAWQQYKSTFDVPADATSLTVFFLINSNGWLQTDDYDIEPYTPVGFSEPLISLTFDDGWSSIYTNGLPILQKYNMPSTQYIVSGFLNTPNYMTPAMVQAFQAEGSEIGSHTVSHPDLTTLTSAQLTTELSDSKTALQQLFGTNAALDFASPYGTYNATVLSAIQQYYQSHRSTDEGFNSKDNFNPYNIRVQNIDTDTTPSEVAAWVAKAKADKTWLVLVYHQVSTSTNPDDYAVTPANLDAELANIQASGVSVKTMAQALAEVESQL